MEALMESNKLFAYAMLGIFVKFVILLVAPRTIKNTFPTYVSLTIMKSYLLMKRVFIVSMI